MKLLVIAVMLLACGNSKQAGPDRWPEVERLATPLVPGGDGALLTAAIEKIKDDDVPEAALADVIAWRKANGGLPWRSGRALDDTRPMRAFQIGKALVERRAEDPEAIETALYLAHRLRTEGGGMLDAMIGTSLAKKVLELKKPAVPAYAAYAPTDAEVRRALAADAVQFIVTLKDLPQDDPTINPSIEAQAKRAYVALVVGAPADRAAYVKHIESQVAKAQESKVLSIILPPRLGSLSQEMFDGVDAYRAWVGLK